MPPSMTDDDLIVNLLNIQIPNTVRISPDSERILYSTTLTAGHRTGKHPVSTLWIATTGQINSERQITSGQFNDHHPRWHPDGKSLAFISDRANPGKSSAIYVLPVGEFAGEPYPLTPTDREQKIERFEYSPDGKHIAFISADEKTPEQRQRDESGDDAVVWGQQWSLNRLRFLDTETRLIKTVGLSQDAQKGVNKNEHVLDLSWSPGGDGWIAFTSARSPYYEHQFLHGTAISVFQFGVNSLLPLCTFPNEILELTWDKPKRLLFQGSLPAHKAAAAKALYAIELSATTPTYKKLAFGVLEDAEGIVKAGSYTLVKVAKDMNTSFEILRDEDSSTPIRSFSKEIGPWDAAIALDAKGRDRSVIAYCESSINSPSEIYSSTNRGDPVQLSSHGAALRGRDFGRSSIIATASSDGLEDRIQGLFLSPAATSWIEEGSRPLKPLATAVLVHGGPDRRNVDAFNHLRYFWTPYLLAHGYAILLVNYRGSTGRGERYAAYAHDGLGVRDYPDVLTLTQYTIELGFADKERLLIGGWSHGGYMAYLSSMRNTNGPLEDPPRNWTWKAAIAGAGVTDPDTMSLTSYLGGCLELNGGAPWTHPKTSLASRQGAPLWEFHTAFQNGGANAIPPMLILHGEFDQMCPLSQAVGMRRALDSVGAEFEMAVYPREGHLIRERAHWRDMLLRVRGWCDRWIGPGIPSEGGAF